MNKDNWGIKAPNSSGGDPRQQNNTLPIMKSTYKELSSDLNRIRQLIEKSHEVKISADSISIAAPQIDVIAQIQKLVELKDSGILSVEEFESAKQKLLGQI
jgi:peptide deformylase